MTQQELNSAEDLEDGEETSVVEEILSSLCMGARKYHLTLWEDGLSSIDMVFDVRPEV